MKYFKISLTTSKKIKNQRFKRYNLKYKTGRLKWTHLPLILSLPNRESINWLSHRTIALSISWELGYKMAALLHSDYRKQIVSHSWWRGWNKCWLHSYINNRNSVLAISNFLRRLAISKTTYRLIEMQSVSLCQQTQPIKVKTKY
jgi:hypothetical protein